MRANIPKAPSQNEMLRQVQKMQEDMQIKQAELDAKEQVILLNNNIPVQIWSMDEDHYTYLTIYQSALNTPATRAAIEMRKMAYIQSWQQARDMQLMWWLPWQAGNQWIMNWVTNNMIQKDNQLKTQPF